MRASTISAAAIAIAGSLACGGGGSQECIGWVEDASGQRHSPQSGVSDPVDAQLFACNGYCLDADPMVDARYAIWLDSPKGKPGTSKKDHMYEDPDFLEYVTVTCANDCVAQVAAGTLTGGVDCTP